MTSEGFRQVQYWDDPTATWSTSWGAYREVWDFFAAGPFFIHEDSGIVVADVARFESWLATLKTNIYEEED